MRRKVCHKQLPDALAECQSLLESGYTMHGNWTLGQICRHIRLTIESNINGYPKWMTVLGYPLRWVLRTVGLPKLLAGKSPKGLPTAPMFVPPESVDDTEEVDALEACIETFLGFDGKPHPHPGFGAMSHEEFEAFHAAHLSHHLGFLVASTEAD